MFNWNILGTLSFKLWLLFQFKLIIDNLKDYSKSLQSLDKDKYTCPMSVYMKSQAFFSPKSNNT